MSIIGRLRVILGADASQLESTLAQTRQQFRAISAAFAATAAAAGTAMLAVSREVIAGANEIHNLSQVANAVPEEFQKWSAATSTVGIEQDKLADILKDVNDRVGDFLSTGGGPMADFFENIAPKVGVTAEQFRHLSGPQALQLYVDSLEKAGVSQGEMTFYLEAMASDLTMMLPLLRNGGAEMARLGSRAEEFGAVLSGPTLVAMQRTQVALAEVGLVFKGMAYQLATAMQPSIEALANAFTALAEKGQPINTAFTLLIDNLGRLATYGATAAAMVGTRMVAGFVAARLATMTLSGALLVLRGALIRTGVGALVVGAGELVYQFGRLVQGAGGFGEALTLLKNVASEVWNRVGLGLQAAGSLITSVWQDIKAVGLDAFAGILAAATEFGNRYIGVYRGAFEAVKAIWSGLPAAIGDMAIGAANALIGGVESMLNAVSDRINKFISMVNDALALLPDWATGGEPITIGAIGRIELGGIANPFAGAARDAGAAAKDAFMKGFNTNTFEAPDTSAITGMADAARGAAETARLAAQTLGTLATGPLTSLGALRDVMNGVATETEGAAGAAERLNDALAGSGADGSGSGSGGGGGRSPVEDAKDQLTDLEQRAQSAAGTIRSSFTDAFKGIASRAQTFGQAVGSILQKLSDMLLDGLGNAIFGGISKSLGGIFASAFPAYANGTPNHPGGLAWVGERGRELVNLPRGSSVIPNNKLGLDRGGQQQDITRVEVVPGPYFDARVTQVSSPLVQAGMQASAQQFGNLATSFNERGTLG